MPSVGGSSIQVSQSKSLETNDMSQVLIDKVVTQIAVPVTEGDLVTITASAAQEKTVTIENLDAANTLQFKFQFSDDGQIFTDVAPLAPLPPLTAVQVVLSGNIFHKLRGLGLLNIAVKVSGRLTFNGTIDLTNV